MGMVEKRVVNPDSGLNAKAQRRYLWFYCRERWRSPGRPGQARLIRLGDAGHNDFDQKFMVGVSGLRLMALADNIAVRSIVYLGDDKPITADYASDPDVLCPAIGGLDDGGLEAEPGRDLGNDELIEAELLEMNATAGEQSESDDHDRNSKPQRIRSDAHGLPD
jgi:hypothetical protein